MTVQALTAECTPLPCYISYPAAGGGTAMVRLLPADDHLVVHVTATIDATGDFGATAAAQTQTPKDEGSVLQAQVSGVAAAPPRFRLHRLRRLHLHLRHHHLLRHRVRS